MILCAGNLQRAWLSSSHLGSLTQIQSDVSYDCSPLKAQLTCASRLLTGMAVSGHWFQLGTQLRLLTRVPIQDLSNMSFMNYRWFCPERGSPEKQEKPIIRASPT